MDAEIEIGTQLLCVKDFKSLTQGQIYQVKGCGDLTWIRGTNKEGPGFSVEITVYDKTKKEWWKHSKIEYYYFKLSEVEKYFITGDAIEKQYTRHKKITQLGL